MYILNKLQNTVIILFLGSKSHNTKFRYSQKKKIKIGYQNTGKLTLKNFDNSSVAMNESWFIEQH